MRNGFSVFFMSFHMCVHCFHVFHLFSFLFIFSCLFLFSFLFISFIYFLVVHCFQDFSFLFISLHFPSSKTPLPIQTTCMSTQYLVLLKNMSKRELNYSTILIINFNQIQTRVNWTQFLWQPLFCCCLPFLTVSHRFSPKDTRPIIYDLAPNLAVCFEVGTAATWMMNIWAATGLSQTRLNNKWLPSGKRLHSYGKPPCLMGFSQLFRLGHVQVRKL